MNWDGYFKRIPQRGAQPMGKVLSFVILCLINLAVVRKSMELDQNRNIDLHSIQALINGDDCVFQMRNPKIWEEISSFAGLENSIGKTFYSKRFIEMNSRSFLISGGNQCENHRYNHKWIEVPFVNYGLVKGMVRSENVEEKGMVDFVKACVRMGACHTDLVKHFDCFYDDLDYLFRFYHNRHLRNQALEGLPFYIPQWLGGLGMSAGPKYYEKIKYQHLQAAEMIFRSFKQKSVKKVHAVPNCLIDLEIQRTFRLKLRELGIDEEINFEMAEDAEANQHVLSDDGQVIYSLMVTELWRRKEVREYFCDPTCADFEMQTMREISKVLHKNSDL